MADPQIGRMRKAIETRIGRLERNAFGVIYGSVTVMALLLAVGHSSDGPIKTAGVLFGSVFAIVLAETFAKISSDAVQKRQSFGWAELWHGWAHSRPTLIAANIPTVLVAAATLGYYSFDTGIILAQIAAIGMLALFGYSIGWVIYGNWFAGVLHAAFTSGIGLGLALIKYMLHG